MSTDRKPGTFSRLASVLADAWADCRLASRRQVEIQIGATPRDEHYAV
jgi:hypothetical protein